MSEPNDCPRLIEVHRLWEGEIDATTATQVRRHLTHCFSCRQEYEHLNRLSGLLARGDPAPSLLPERQRLMKEKLLGDCSATLGVPDGATSSRSVLSATIWRWWRPLRFALALPPLATILLLLLLIGRTAPPREVRSPPLESHPDAAGSAPQSRSVPRPPQIVRAPSQASPLPSQRPKLAARSVRRRAARRSRRLVHAASPMAMPRRRQLEVASRQAPASTPLQERKTMAPPLAPAPPPPIERIVIQVDEPPAPPPVEAGTVTHIAVVAVGDPDAPGAQLTVVKSQKLEALP